MLFSYNFLLLFLHKKSTQHIIMSDAQFHIYIFCRKKPVPRNFTIFLFNKKRNVKRNIILIIILYLQEFVKKILLLRQILLYLFNPPKPLAATPSIISTNSVRTALDGISLLFNQSIK